MYLLLLSLALLFIAGICFLERAAVAARNRLPTVPGIKVVVVVRDQEMWVEGFIRKLFLSIKGMPQAEVLVVDDCSSDQTPEILRRLQGKYFFKLISAGKAGAMDEQEGRTGVIRFDARGFGGKELLCVPLFHHLSCLNRR